MKIKNNNIATSVLFVLVAYLLSILFYKLSNYIYTKNFSVSKTDISWGVFLQYSFYYGYPILLLLGALIFSVKNNLIRNLPIIMFSITILFMGYENRPLRTLLLSLCFVFSYIISHRITKILINKRRKKLVN